MLNDPQTTECARREASALVREQSKELAREREQAEAELERVRRRFLRWAEQLSDDVITADEHREFRDELEARRAQLTAKLHSINEELERAGDREAEWEAVQRALADIQGLWESMTAEERRELIREVIERVDMYKAEDGGTELHIRLRVGRPVIRKIPSLRDEVLTPRQMAMLWLLGQGLTRKQIARRLGQSVTGMNNTLRSARLRLGAASVDEAVDRARPIIEPYVKWLDFEGREQRLPIHGQLWPTLTPEEQQVLTALSEGLSGTQIATHLGKKPNTVYVQLHNMREKLGAGNNQQLLKFAREAGLLPGPTRTSPQAEYLMQRGAQTTCQKVQAMLASGDSGGTYSHRP